MATTPDRPLRADAERNRRLIVQAAAEAFAEEGLEVGVAEIARRAGVGNATVFRRFPTKEELVLAIVEDRMAKVLASGREALTEPDPWRALETFAERTVALQAADRGFLDAVEHVVLADPKITERRHAIIELTGELVHRAQEARVVRPDVTALDLVLLLLGISHTQTTLPGARDDLWRRYLALALDGLRPADASPLPVEAPSMDEVDEALARAPRRGCRAG